MKTDRASLNHEGRGLALALALGLGLLTAGCGEGPLPRAAPRPAPTARAGKSATPRREPLVGVVRQVNRDTGVVAIRHEAIPGFMPEMTMPFDLKGQEALEDVQVGDKVRGTLVIEAGEARLRDVEIVEMAVAPSPEPTSVPTLSPGETAPDFQMTLADGRTLWLHDLRGTVVVLTFIYTRCPLPNFCPLMDKNFSELARWVQAHPQRAERVRLLSVSFDPEHDTPEVLRTHSQLRGAHAPIWQFAVANHEELRKVGGPLGLRYALMGDEIIHGLSTAVIGPDGRLVSLVEGNTWKPDELRKTIAGRLDLDQHRAILPEKSAVPGP